MRLAKVRVRGFQSFGDSHDIRFDEGINLIIGQNNAGKSALLRALLPNLPDDRHRTPERWEAFRLPMPRVDMTVTASGHEIEEWLLIETGQQHVPVTNEQVQDVRRYMKEFFSSPKISLEVYRIPDVSNFVADYPSHKLFAYVAGSQQTGALIQSRDGELQMQPQYSGSDTLPSVFWNAWNRNMFYFTAERMMIGESSQGHATRLTPNASNLPNVLHTLSNERGTLFQRLVGHLREIFSTIGNVSVRTNPNNSLLEVRVWPTIDMERVELSFPLNSGGTGVAQVVAILTAVMTIENSVIIIDEVNSFLHPAAVKALLRILQIEYCGHQYIISTHAPEVISFSNPSSIHLVKRVGYESSIVELDLESVDRFQSIAEHLGVSMADVFAAERVVWVEGPTEELCFPYIYNHCVGALPRSTVVTSVAATGDFNTKKRDPTLVYEVYSRLSAAAATLVVSVAFSFDTEKLTEAEKTDMQRQANGRLHFLPRRHLECYLVDPGAIAAFITNKSPEVDRYLTSEDVKKALESAASQHPHLIDEWTGTLDDVVWLKKVDAAKLITAVCSQVSEHRVSFSKKDDTLFLIRHILESNSGKLSALSEYVVELIESVAENGTE